jgi:hypothetical protein
MKSSKRVTELNNRSVELTDAELRNVDKFSVSLPMNELPEVVVVSPQPIAPPRNYDGPATIPFLKDKPGLETGRLQPEPVSHSTAPENAHDSTQSSGSQSSSFGTDVSPNERTGGIEDHASIDRDSNGISIPDIQDAESVLLDTHPYESPSANETSVVNPSTTAESKTELDESADFIEAFTNDLELPQDELAILNSDDSSANCDSESNEKLEEHHAEAADLEVAGPSDDAPANATAIYKIEDYAIHENRFERIAKGVETELENKPSSVVLITSPSHSESIFGRDSIQHATANNLLSVLANRNPTMRIISVQANETGPDQQEQFSPGLGEVLSEENELADVVIPTTIDNLDYLAFSDCGSVLSSSFKPRVEKIVSELRKHYDLIFINGKSAEETETKSWTAIADATYLIVQLYGDDQTAAKEAATQLRKNGGRLVGCIVIQPE